MPNRILKETICVSESIDALLPMEEIVFYRLLVNCDDFGRMDGRTAILRAKLFPLRAIAPEQLQSALDHLEALQMIRRYKSGGKPYLLVVNWDAHQSIRAKRSKFPAPEGDRAGEPADGLPTPEADTGPSNKEASLLVPPVSAAGKKPEEKPPVPDVIPPEAAVLSTVPEQNSSGSAEGVTKPSQSGKVSPSPIRGKAKPCKKAPRHVKKKAAAHPNKKGGNAQPQAPPIIGDARAGKEHPQICAPPGDTQSMQASASNCMHVQADEIICKQLQADASTCSRNPIHIQSESEKESESVSVGLLTDADAAAWREGLSAIEKRAESLGMPFAGADRNLAESLMAEFTLPWVLEAMRRAGEGQASCRSWRYIRAILNAWRAKGGIDSVHGGCHPGGEQQGHGGAQSDVRAALHIRRY